MVWCGASAVGKGLPINQERQDDFGLNWVSRLRTVVPLLSSIFIV